MAALWTYEEQQAIKPIDGNQPESLFDQLSIEVQTVELKRLLGNEFYNDLVNNADDYSDLLDGTSYLYDGVKYNVSGLKYVLAYFFYARYLGENGVLDTFSGFVNHNYDDANRVSLGQIKNMQSEVRAVAESYWLECRGLMIEKGTTEYPYFKCYNKKTKIRIL